MKTSIIQNNITGILNPKQVKKISENPRILEEKLIKTETIKQRNITKNINIRIIRLQTQTLNPRRVLTKTTLIHEKCLNTLLNTL